MKLKAKYLLGGVAAALCLGGTALAVAPTGIQNVGFEDGLAGWTAFTNGDPNSVRSGVYVMTQDTSVTPNVLPTQGSKMVRLGRPLPVHGDDSADRMRLEQDFVVAASDPVIDLDYNIFTWESYSPATPEITFDPTDFIVRLTDDDGDLLYGKRVVVPGTPGTLRSTGWLHRQIDLTAHVGQQVHLSIAAGETTSDGDAPAWDGSFPTWAYLDGLPPAPPADPGPIPGGGDQLGQSGAKPKPKPCKKKSKGKKSVASASKKRCKKPKKK
jgi:hypothetical protein